MKKRIKQLFKNFGYKGIILIIVFLGMFKLGYDAWIINKESVIILYISGILTAILFKSIVLRHYKKFNMFTAVFVITAVFIGFIKDIEAVESFISEYEYLFTPILSLLIGICVTGMFFVYSDPDIVLNEKNTVEDMTDEKKIDSSESE